MPTIEIGDRVRFQHSECPDPIIGTVTNTFLSEGSPVATIDYGGKYQALQLVEFLTLTKVMVNCAGPECPAVTYAYPRAHFCCPNHLDHLFPEPAGSIAGDCSGHESMDRQRMIYHCDGSCPYPC